MHLRKIRETQDPVTLKEVNNLLEFGKILISVLTEEELKQLKNIIVNTDSHLNHFFDVHIGNTGVS